MRFLTAIFSLCVCSSGIMSGQDKADAIINSFEEVFTMKSLTNGTDKIHKTITVFNDEGLDAASFVVFIDSFRSLGSFTGEVITGNGQRIKLTKKDLNKTSLSIGLADDIYVMHLSPDYKYPFTITYDYTVEYKNGILSFPVFQPVECDGVSLESGSYTLIVPRNTEISYHESCLEYSKSTKGGNDVHLWTTEDVKPFVDEHLSKLDDSLFPQLYAVPIVFEYGGVRGKQSDWKDMSAWLYSLQDKVNDLPESEIDVVKKMVTGAENTYVIVRRIYSYLSAKTRYVSIQLGLGGLRPLPASHVVNTGFGDCKALTNYMKALLEVAGVESYYYAISTDRKTFIPDVCSATQMNHVMLAVPLKEKSDTLFIECTNPKIPLGYRHDNCAGHEILVVEKGGGKKVRIGDYPDSLRQRIHDVDILLSDSGSAHITVKDRRRLNFSEDFIGFSSIAADHQVKYLIKDWSLQPNNIGIVRIYNNFDDYGLLGKAFCPEAEVEYSMDVKNFANKNGERLFLPINSIAKSIFYQRSERKNRVYNEDTFTLIDTFSIILPEGYKVESVPEDVSLSTVWGDFSSTITISGSVIKVSQTLNMKSFDEDSKEYRSYREFAKSVNKAYTAKIVICS